MNKVGLILEGLRRVDEAKKVEIALTVEEIKKGIMDCLLNLKLKDFNDVPIDISVRPEAIFVGENMRVKKDLDPANLVYNIALNPAEMKFKTSYGGFDPKRIGHLMILGYYSTKRKKFAIKDFNDEDKPLAKSFVCGIFDEFIKKTIYASIGISNMGPISFFLDKVVQFLSKKSTPSYTDVEIVERFNKSLLGSELKISGKDLVLNKQSDSKSLVISEKSKYSYEDANKYTFFIEIKSMSITYDDKPMSVEFLNRKFMDGKIKLGHYCDDTKDFYSEWGWRLKNSLDINEFIESTTHNFTEYLRGKYDEYIVSSLPEFYVFRIGTENTSLIDNNAANALGEEYFIGQYLNDFLEAKDRGNYVTLFKVKNLKGEFGPYSRFNKSSINNPNREHTPNVVGEPIGREKKGKGGFWYSFPRDGAWDSERIAKVSLKEIWDKAMEDYANEKNKDIKDIKRDEYYDIKFAKYFEEAFRKYM